MSDARPCKCRFDADEYVVVECSYHQRLDAQVDEARSLLGEVLAGAPIDEHMRSAIRALLDGAAA